MTAPARSMNNRLRISRSRTAKAAAVTAPTMVMPPAVIEFWMCRTRTAGLRK
ncbi:MAG: hypothetical protein BWY77_01562 [bacterium ADurb.Bin431]|nr:MAG: hypothetical protein BWY77_01562 [bacterium ADurb.Bin431]